MAPNMLALAPVKEKVEKNTFMFVSREGYPIAAGCILRVAADLQIASS